MAETRSGIFFGAHQPGDPGTQRRQHQAGNELRNGKSAERIGRVEDGKGGGENQTDDCRVGLAGKPVEQVFDDLGDEEDPQHHTH